MTPLPAPFAPSSYRDVLFHLQQRAIKGIEAGEYEPFTYPYRSLGPNLLILYLLIPPTRSKLVHYLRYPLFLFIVYHAVDGTLRCKSPMVTVGYGIGLLNGWAVLWSACLLIFNDARTEHRRIEEVRVKEPNEARAPSGGNEDSTEGQQNLSDGPGLRRRNVKDKLNQQNGLLEQRPISPNDQHIQYRWQSLPQNALHRLDWVADLTCSFRGPRWSHQISGLAPPPHQIQSQLQDPSHSEPTPYSTITRSYLLKRNLPQFLLCLLALDALKTTTMQDPYFWSLGSSAISPFRYPGPTRLLLSAAFAYVSLQTIFILSPLVFACMLGPAVIGQHAQPWLYAPYFGSPRAVAKKGLAAAWGQWWQQVFRYGFEQAGEAAAKVFGAGWGAKTKKGGLLRVSVAFACSGILHACASYTTVNESWPISGSFAFFMVQPVGLLGQRAVSGWMRVKDVRDWLPQVVREVGNVVFVVAWFWLTGPLIADDFAATGIWLYEPLPFSLLRGLRGEGWWFWGGTWVRWHTASKWWQSGVAF